MKSYVNHTIPSKPSITNETQNFKKEGMHEDSFFGMNTHDPFFKPAPAIQKKCEKCEDEGKKNAIE